MADEAVLETAGAAVAELAVEALLTQGGRIVPCGNCAAPLTGPYCAQCGQAAHSHRRSVTHLLHDLVKDVASFDSRILRTVEALLFRPGELALAFRENRIQRYVPAVRLYLFVSLIFFVALSASGIALVQFVPVVKPMAVKVEGGKVYARVEGDTEWEKMPARYADGKPHFNYSVNNAVFFAREGALHVDVPAGALRAIDASLARRRMQANESTSDWVSDTVDGAMRHLIRDPAALNSSLTAWMPRMLFLLMPLFALLLAAFYPRQRRQFFFVDHMVFSLGLHSFGFVLLLAAAALAQLMPASIAALLAAAGLAIYLALAMKRFYAQNWLWTGAKAFGVAALYTVFCVIPAAVGILVVSVIYG